MDEPHEVQASATSLALCTLDNFHTRDVRVKHLHGHLNGDTSELVSQQERGVNATHLNAQNNTIERVAVLECDPNDISRLNTARIPAVVEQSLTLTLRVDYRQLRLGDACDWVLAYGASGGRRRVDLDRLGGCDG